jgi:acetyl-CoA C-acetyltransferase
MRPVCVVGAGMSQWGEVWRKSFRDLYVDAARAAIKNAGVDHIDPLYGCMTGDHFVCQDISAR